MVTVSVFQIEKSFRYVLAQKLLENDAQLVVKILK
jgi:hypothetical protein